MSCQVHCDAVLAKHRRADRLHRRWRFLLTRCYQYECAKMMRDACALLNSDGRTQGPQRSHNAYALTWSRASRPENGWAASNKEWAASSSPARVHRFSAAAREAAELGLDEATYRLLKELEAREITPEDYGLLSQLDESVKPPTLSSEELSRFPIEIYSPALLSVRSPCLSRLLLTTIEASEGIVASEAGIDSGVASFGPDFWRLPLPQVSELSDLNHTDVGSPSRTSGSTCSGGSTCGVCLVDFESGDEIRTLVPCGHRFHRDCIDHWLLERSTACPVDKQELRKDE